MSEAKVAKVWTDEQALAEVEALAADWRMVLNGEQVRLLRTEIYATWRKLNRDMQAKLDAAQQRIDAQDKRIAELEGELAGIYGDKIEVAQKVSNAGASKWDLQRYKQLAGRDYDESEGDE